MNKQNFLLLILGIIQVMVAVGALPVGYLFIVHPDGSALGMNIEMLKNSPFSDYLIPGIALFLFNGIYHLTSAIICFLRNNLAPYFAAISGIGLIIWILVQVYAIGLNSYLQPVYLTIGFSEFILGLILIKRKYVESTKSR